MALGLLHSRTDGKCSKTILTRNIHEMPIDPSVYQYCEAQDIPLHYLPEYEEQSEREGFEWENFLLIFFLIMLALPLVILVAGIYAVGILTL